MELEALLIAALREAGYGPDAIGSAMPRIIRIMQAEDVRIEMGRSLSRKEREYVRLQLELGLNVSEVVAGLKKCRPPLQPGGLRCGRSPAPATARRWNSRSI